MYTHEAEVSRDQNEKSLPPKIPIRNIWFLFLFAYDLAQFQGTFDGDVEASPDLKSLLTRLLCHAVEQRLRRNVSLGYRRRAETLKRVRGRIDILKTTSQGLFARGEVACRFYEMTVDTPRNRLIRSALSHLAGVVEDRELAHRARSMSGMLERAGVSAQAPSRAEISSDQIGRHESQDRLMVSLARAAFDLVLPTETDGSRPLYEAVRDEVALRKIFEKAVANFYASELPASEGWRVYASKRHAWPVTAKSPAFANYLPTMETDIILENQSEERRIIVDTKYTRLLTRSRYSRETFKTGHMYQLYAYLRTQEQPGDPLSPQSEGLLLYPSLGVDLDEAALVQGHRMRFATIDLSQPTLSVSESLRSLPFQSLFR